MTHIINNKILIVYRNRDCLSRFRFQFSEIKRFILRGGDVHVDTLTRGFDN